MVPQPVPQFSNPATTLTRIVCRFLENCDISDAQKKTKDKEEKFHENGDRLATLRKKMINTMKAFSHSPVPPTKLTTPVVEVGRSNKLMYRKVQREAMVRETPVIFLKMLIILRILSL